MSLTFQKHRLSIKDLPHQTGVYIFRGEKNEILYVGKAIDLKTRISFYWRSNKTSPRTTQLAEKTKDVETIIVNSELEALILEANLIKKYKPLFNIRLMDDKDYLYIKITKELFPKIIASRKKDLLDAYKFFGPFPSSKIVRSTLKTLRKIFPWCSNPPNGKKVKVCFYYHLGLCPGACAGKIDKNDYRKNINLFVRFMEGKKESLIKNLRRKMQISSDRLDFETSATIKKMIFGINYITQPNKVSDYLENSNFLEEENKKALLEIKAILNLETLPIRIEGYDISNIQGKEAVGSMVVLTDGQIDKSQYRKFKIGISGKPNDIAMHQEMIRRRLHHPEWALPNLLIIDGGRGQARGVENELLKAGFNIPIFGLAKKEEWLYPTEGEIIKLPKGSLALRLLQKIRDEAHRFAISYHRKLRSKSFGLN